MGLRIQNNVEAFNTHRQLTTTSTQAAKSMEKLSSGYRINRAADDAAGLAISEKMRGQIGGLAQAQRNAQDGVSLAGIKRILELETHVSALQARVRELSDELDRVQAAAGLSRRVFAAGPGGEVVSLLAGRRPDRSAFGPSTALVVWRPRP